jgi:uncharacterized protein involved in response to NO
MGHTAFLMRGFRPFFSGAGIFALLAMVYWLVLYSGKVQLPESDLSAMQWHAHEMIYGYAIAVICGFLLTAAQNWTGISTLKGGFLAGLFILWCAARVLLLPGMNFLLIAAAFDLLFMLLLFAAIAYPVLKVKQKRQAPVLVILALLFSGNLIFYLGLLGKLPNGARLGIDIGLYLVLGMVLFMGRRVIPFFAETGTGKVLAISRPRWIDISLFVLYPVFFVKQVFLTDEPTALVSISLFLVTAIQLIYWHKPGIWKKPLLWSLYVAFAFISSGFLLQGLVIYTDISMFLPLHAFTVGGIGLITLSMMTRVSLGHTGRTIHQSPFVISLAILLLIIGSVSRVALPLVMPSLYVNWVMISGMCWVMAFTCFAIYFLPKLTRPRVDGKSG